MTAQEDSLLRVAGEAVRKLLRDPDWESQLREVVENLGQAVGASRCYVFEKHVPPHGGVVLQQRAEWQSPDLPFQSEASPDDQIVLQPNTDLGWLSRLSSGERVDYLDDGCPEDVRKALTVRDVKSLIVAPVFVESDWWGCVGLDDCVGDRIWSESEQSALHIVADALGAAVERRNIEYERARVSAIVQYSDDAIIGKKLDGTITDWSVGASRIYQYSPEEMLGESVERLLPDDEYDDWLDLMDRLRSGKPIDHLETTRVRKDGTRLIVSISISPIWDGRGELVGAVTIARDVTEGRRAEIELRASEERLRLALEAGEVGAWDWDIETGHVIWSENMERLHGLAPGTFEGTFGEFMQGVHPDDRQVVEETIHRSLEQGSDYQIEYRSSASDGSVVWLSARGRVIVDSQGKPVRMTGICTDISQRKRNDEIRQELLTQLDRARSQAERERDHLEELFQHAPALMALLEGPDHVFRMANDHYLGAVGWRDVIGKPVRDALPEVRKQGVIELLDSAYLSGETITRSELPVYLDVRGTGAPELRYFSFAYQPNRNEEGNITGVLVHAVDLTDHVRARHRVEELAAATASERDRLQQIIDVLPEGIAIADQNGIIQLSNMAARHIWGQSAPEGGIEDYDVFGTLRPDGSPVQVDELPLSRSVLHGETVLGEQLLIHNPETGVQAPVLVNSAPLRDADSAIIGGLVVFQDISSLKEFERQKDEFLQAVSHDLKNPLTTIRGYSQLLARSAPADPDRLSAALESMDSATNRALGMLDEILDLTRLQMGRPLELAIVPTDIVGLVSRLVDQHQATTENHEVRLESHVPELTGEWDSMRLERVFANLLVNAITYSPEGGRVNVRIDRQDGPNGPLAVIQVQDEGLGIPSRDLPRLFERFWRGSNVRDYYRGTGLGLAGVKAIVEAHGGDVQVDSVEGEGSTFTVRLPVNADDS